ncbi:MAG: ribosome biogenesis GTP-binding protein YihA/YsxC [Acidobacteria bacterium]|nr:ribosome biogenesis GTP-binding protein YihA/YsxC [Acidobacteriota bacterium]
MTFSGSASSSAQFPRDGLPEVAFLGRSNVGKSSLLNALAGVKGLARVSSDPGRTRLINFFRVLGAARPGGGGHGDMYLVDLPGYGYAKAPRQVREGWERLVTSYMDGRDPLQLCVFIVDARHEPSEGDHLLRTWLDHHGHPYVVAANKVDKMGRGEARRRERAIAEAIGSGARAVVPVSATRRTGVDELWNIIRAAAFDRQFEARE